MSLTVGLQTLHTADTPARNTLDISSAIVISKSVIRTNGIPVFMSGLCHISSGYVSLDSVMYCY